MKRILIALAMLAAVQVADAQVKTPDAAAKAVEKAEVAANDAKKAAKVATWTKLAQAYMDAYNAPAGNVWLGASKQELQFVMASEKPLAVEEVVLSQTPYVKETYANKAFYYNNAGQLQMIVVTKPVVENSLAKALEAYKKAYEVDVKQSKLKDIKAGIAQVSQKYVTDAYNCYTLGDYAEASKLFALAADASNTAPYSQLDTNSLYNAGFTAMMVEDLESAKKYFLECLAVGYYYEGGEVFARLATIYEKLGDNEKSAEILEQGFTKFPDSQSILIGLINYYLTNNKDTNRLFELINMAKKNEPNNASLYYVEGNINKELGNIDAAVAAYYKCSEINPEYEYGYIGAGVMYYDLAVKVSEQAQTEMDNNKYDALVAQFEQYLLDALKPFEQAYETTKDQQLKVSIAEYLKNIYYRFYSKGAEYEAGYNKYDAVVKGAK